MNADSAATIELLKATSTQIKEFLNEETCEK